MGMDYETFLSLYPQQFQEAYDAWRIKLEADREHHELTLWQAMRWQTFKILRPPDPNAKISMFDLLELPGDSVLKEITQQKPSTRSRFEELKNKWD